jgi:hypothetical protein
MGGMAGGGESERESDDDGEAAGRIRKKKNPGW